MVVLKKNGMSSNYFEVIKDIDDNFVSAVGLYQREVTLSFFTLVLDEVTNHIHRKPPSCYILCRQYRIK